MAQSIEDADRIICLESPEAVEVADRVCDHARDLGLSVQRAEVGSSPETQSESLGVAVGGDGTFLEGVRVFAPAGLPMLAVNAGTLGFLARVGPEDAGAAIEEVVDGRADVIEREQLAVTGGGLDATGINDVMVEPTPVDNPTDTKICRLHAWVDGEYVGEYAGSGLVVSTPTGSTGVALSAGGPVHYPNDNHALQVMPLNTHNIGVRPLIVDGDAVIRVVPEDEVRVMVDGGRSHAVVEPGTPLEVSGADQTAHIVRTSQDESFFDALSGSLGWGLRDVDEAGPDEYRGE